jgi:hypothetical protein
LVPGLDLLLRGGLIIDGSGNASCDVAVEDERVRILRGDTAGIEARRVVSLPGGAGRRNLRWR